MMNGNRGYNNQPSKSTKLSSRANGAIGGIIAPAGSGALLPVSPMRTVSKQAQRRAAQQMKEMDEDLTTINNGKKHRKGKRGHDEEEDFAKEIMAPVNGRDGAIDRINTAIDGFATRVASINARARSRPSSAHLDSDDAYGQRKASGASNYHRDATMGVDGQLKSTHIVREVHDTLTRGERRMKRDERIAGEAGIVSRLNKMADDLAPSTITDNAAKNVYASGHEHCNMNKHTRHVVHEQPHRARRAATRGLIAHGEVHGVEALGHSGNAKDNSLQFFRSPHNHSYALDLSA